MDVIPPRNFPVGEAALREALGHVENGAATLGFGRDTQLKLMLITEELYTNVINHGAAASRVEIALRRDGSGQAVLNFADDGTPFNPLEQLPHASHDLPPDERPVGGLGVVLLDGFCAAVHYHRAGGRNCLEMFLRP